ncbi:class I SAM-dependent methyltransferase [Subsaxibacter sp. CAU 1640]|uniref:methyltransferase domain-containing protein n=1 Tax=Subsaxibacter sp. CAU 1640 TaxID=2933271 RepID=UPI002003B76A|nr:methyltransferase domain-containing protein [Subsaxibacter sp. CAU 1640]MCK7589890.1 class I SAM-dependent methyltransferase [Subsaxibacter sp. CAU 1640]
MTRYEWFRWFTFPVMPVHLQTVRSDIKKLVKKDIKSLRNLHILDVGGRKSPYSVGIDADFTLMDIPQEGGTKTELNLGFTEAILSTIQKKRSNIKDLIIQDMTACTLRDSSYDAVVCVEVIEHVEADTIFVENISKVIKPGGWAYFTTPNGDYIKNEGINRNLDHIRHYTKDQLKALLSHYFHKVDVHYAVKTGKYRLNGLKGFKKNNPAGVIKAMASNVINKFQSKNLDDVPVETAHLVAIAYKLR